MAPDMRMLSLLVELGACSASCTHGASTAGVIQAARRPAAPAGGTSASTQLAAHEEEQLSCVSGVLILLTVALALLSSPRKRDE